MTTVSQLSKATPMAFMSAMRHFFGTKPGQTIVQFRDELKALTDDDKAYFRKHLIADGYIMKDSDEVKAAETVLLAKAA